MGHSVDEHPPEESAENLYSGAETERDLDESAEDTNHADPSVTKHENNVTSPLLLKNESNDSKNSLKTATQSNPEDADSSEDDAEPYMDHGWAWLIVVACSLMHMLVGGVARSYSIVYMYLLDRFGGSAAVAAWIGGACSALRMGASPLSTALVHRFSARSVVFVGGLLTGLSGVLSAFAPSTEYMFFSYSFLAGFGGALVYSPGIVIVGQYFKRYRSIAIGLSTAGSGLGVFLFPPFLEYLFGNFSFFGGMLIMGAISFNNCVCGMLYRSPGALVRKEKNKIETVNSSHNEESANLTHVKKTNLTKTLEEGLSTSSKSLFATHSPALKRPVRHSKSVDELENKTLQSQINVQSTETNIEEPKEDKSCCTMNNVYKYLDVRLLKDPIFLCYITCLGFMTMSYISGQMLLPPFAKEQGISQDKSVWLLSVLGISDIIGRVGSGLVFNIPFIKAHRRHYYNAAILISALTHYFWAVSGTYAMFVVVSALHGLFTGVIVSQRATICIDLMGIEKLPSSFGLAVFVQGLGILIGPALAGLMRDLSGSYWSSFVLTGSASIFAAAILFTEWLFISRKKNAQKSSTASNTVTA